MSLAKIQKIDKALNLEDQLVLSLNSEIANLYQEIAKLNDNAEKIAEELASENQGGQAIQHRSWSIGWNEVLSAKLLEIERVGRKLHDEVRKRISKIQHRKARIKSLEKLKMELTRQQQKIEESLQQIEDLDRFLNRDWNH